MNGVVHDVKVYLRTLLLYDTCRWLADEEDAWVVGGVITHDHQLLLLRLLPLCRQVLLLPPSHKMVQLGTQGVK